MSGLDRRTFLSTIASSAAAGAQTNRRPARPNVLIILTDDQGYGDFSCHGNPVLKTPNMDKLHSESVRFTDFHVAPMCTPTRGQLMTGVDALRNAATSVSAGRSMVRREFPTMADVFSSAGYRTGLFGKWHLGDNYPFRPMDRGFHEAKYHLGWGFSSAPEFDNDYFNGRYHDNGVVRNFKGYCTDFWFDQAMAWMKERKQRSEPFLYYLPTNTPHTPAWVDEKYSKPYADTKAAAFFGMIANLDENLGRMEAFLRESGLRDNTIVVFMTDNGGTGGVTTFNAGMRARKTQIYDGGHRVPCFVRWPAGRLRNPGDVQTAAQIQDVLPTLAELCDLKTAAKPKYDGRSLAPLLKDPKAQLPDRMMVVQYGQIPKKWDSCVIHNRWRLVGKDELYDLARDQGQQTNLAASEPGLLSKMQAHYEKWWAGVEPRLNDFVPITIGSDKANPVFLSSSDWQEVYCDNARQVSEAAGGPRGNAWNISIERAGDYEVLLSRWPPHMKLALTAGRAAQKMTAGELPSGKALPIAAARLQCGSHDLTAKAEPGAMNIVFRIKLQAQQRAKLHAWFQDVEGKDLSGAFYAAVRRVG